VKTVILAAGDFPKRDGAAWNILAAAKRVICCDSAADQYRRRFKRDPDFVVGDLDSVRGEFPETVFDPDENVNDLGKAVRFVRSRGWNDLVIAGASGKREDHTIGNFFRALAEMVEVVTDYGVFRPVCGKASFAAAKGAGVSVFAPDPATVMTSKGLQWPLDGVKFGHLFCATLNRASSTRFTVTSDRPVGVYVEAKCKSR
jgi:thiamine pyrophosphokinase